MLKFILNNSSTLIVIIVISSLIVSLQSIYKVSNKIREELTLSEVKNLSRTLSEFRQSYTSEVVSKLQQSNIEVTHDYINKKNAIPLPATLSMHIGNNLNNNNDGNIVRLYSPYPFPHREKEGGLRDEFEKRAWAELNRQPTVAYKEVTNLDGVLKIRYAISDVLGPSCVNCHNTHPNTPKKGWKEGDVRGILEVQKIINTNDVTTYKNKYYTIFKAVLPIIITSIILALIVKVLKSTINKLDETNSQLLEKSTLLQHSVEDLKNINKVLAHDLKTPIVGISSLTYHIEEDLESATTDEVQKKLIDIRNRAEVMHKLIEGYNNYLNKSNKPLVQEKVDINSMLKNLLAHNENKESIQLNLTKEPTQIITDKNKVAIALKELINNAFEHNKEKAHLQVTISTRVLLNEIAIAIMDNGKGIPEEFHRKVLQPFQTLESKSVAKGIGIGLALVKKCIEQIEGNIQFKKIDPSGLSVTLKIPSKKA